MVENQWMCWTRFDPRNPTVTDFLKYGSTRIRMHKRTSKFDPLVALERSMWKHESWGKESRDCRAKFQNFLPYGSRGYHKHPSQKKKNDDDE